jgi:hypothetical protein
MPSEIERVRGGNLNLTRGSISHREGERQENQHTSDLENKTNTNPCLGKNENKR